MLYVHTTILPDSPHVVLRGRASEASGQELAGRVLIRLNRSLKVKNVSISFRAANAKKSQLWGSPDIIQNTFKSLKSELFTAADSPTGYDIWDSTSDIPYEFPFSFIIPGHLHESVHTEFGHVTYELRVFINSSGFGINTWTESLPIPVYRVPKEGSSWSVALHENLRMQADWMGAVELEVSSDTVAVNAKTKMNVQAIIRPLQKEQMLVDIGLRLIEKQRLKAAVDKYGDPHSSEKMICESHLRVDDPEGTFNTLPLNQEHKFDLALNIPAALHGIQHDMDTAKLCVKHELVFTATVLDKAQEPHYLRISTPVIIAFQTMADHFFFELPTYTGSASDRLLLDDSRPSPSGESTGNGHEQEPPSYQNITPSYQSISAT
ncbi:hypothetical protein GGI07_003670 [Coemansia sp. Benny D115]|nr:hypothetical protein GGI07_003670 [Coemansia sp. Benny D115]